MAKVKFGLSNIHLFKLTETTDSETGAVTSSYGNAMAFPGAVELSLSVESDEPDPFYADDSVYYQPAAISKGYSGTLTMARLTDDIKTAFLNFVKDQDNTVIEVNGTEKKYFAMTCENDSDDMPIKKVFYKCSFGTPDISMATIEDQKTPETDAIPITIIPTAEKFSYIDSDGNERTTSVVSGTADKTSDATVYNNWHQEPHMPNFDTES
jgi:phi13 family phage major tail protein